MDGYRRAGDQNTLRADDGIWVIAEANWRLLLVLLLWDFANYLYGSPCSLCQFYY